jgi:cytochrome c peroxidase
MLSDSTSWLSRRDGKSWSFSWVSPRCWVVTAAIAGLIFVTASTLANETPVRWSTDELARLGSLRIKSSLRVGPDPSNKVVTDSAAAEFGQRIFFDTRLSRTDDISCESCHHPGELFSDGQARSNTLGVTKRHAPSLVGASFSEWFYWDGSRDSQWAQALTPIERQNEMSFTRIEAARLIAEDKAYSATYSEIFGESPDLSDRSRFPGRASPVGSEQDRLAWEAMTPEDRDIVNRIFSNLGKALAAYERKLIPGPSRFDRYVEGVEKETGKEPLELSDKELTGLRLFISDRVQCMRCHNGPMFSNYDFHNTGVPQADFNDPDLGRVKGVEEALEDEFNCLGPYSDAVPEQCVELNFVKQTGEELMGAFKVPSLRNVAETAPYMHAGQYKTLGEVLSHYSRPPAQNIGHLELSTLNLTDDEIEALDAFLGTLTSEIAADPGWLSPLAAP